MAAVTAHRWFLNQVKGSKGFAYAWAQCACVRTHVRSRNGLSGGQNANGIKRRGFLVSDRIMCEYIGLCVYSILLIGNVYKVKQFKMW